MIEVPALERIVIDTVGGKARSERFAFEILDGAAVADIGAALERLDIEDSARSNFQLHIAGILGSEMLHVFVCEIEHSLGAARDDPSAEEHT